MFRRRTSKIRKQSVPTIGIDLGTTYCCVGYSKSNDIVEIIENKEGERVTPSYVAYDDDVEIIGKYAKDMIFQKPGNVVYDVKKLIGQKCDSNFMQRIKTYNWPFQVTSDADDNPLIEMTRNGKTETYTPQQLSAILLKYMKTRAEETLETEVKDAVITVPAHFNYHQRTATKEAGELAGLNVLKIINEPTAAALAYVHKNEISGKLVNVLVFDLGGGTFDVSIISVEKKSVTVRATAGHTALGGRDFDNNLSEFIVNKIEETHEIKIRTNALAIHRIREQSEKLKHTLSAKLSTNVELSSLTEGKDAYYKITRSDFDEMNRELFQICIDTVQDCLRSAKMKTTEIDKVVLVGGATRIPKVQEMLKEFFGGKQLTKAINPDEAVAYGAAVQAAMFSNRHKKDMHYKVNDVTPLSLGICVEGGLMNVIIPRNSKIPISKTQNYITTYNNQISTAIAVYEGERSLIQHNTRIGISVLQLPPKPPGYTFDITFHVNANGILEVSAKTADGDYTGLTIKYEKSKSHMTNDILKDAKINKSKDNKISEVIQKWNTLKDYCSKMEALCDYDKKGIKEEEKIDIGIICKEVRIWLDANEVRHGSPQEEADILNKSKEIEGVCEPIANRYQYYIKDMNLIMFHKLILK